MNKMRDGAVDEVLNRKLRILADAAKYDASCASAGAKKRGAKEGGIGSTDGNGICHAYTPDGRCVSLLKILLTNYCLYDCAYCINRRSSNTERARFKVDEVVRLTIEFYKRIQLENGGDVNAGGKLGAWMEAAGFRNVRMDARYECYKELPLIGEYLAQRIELAAETDGALEKGWTDAAGLARMASALRRGSRIEGGRLHERTQEAPWQAPSRSRAAVRVSKGSTHANQSARLEQTVGMGHRCHGADRPRLRDMAWAYVRQLRSPRTLPASKRDR